MTTLFCPWRKGKADAQNAAGESSINLRLTATRLSKRCPIRLHSSKTILQTLFEASPHPYLVLRADSHYTIVAVNTRYMEATGTRRERIVGHGLFEIFPDNPDDPSTSGVIDLRASLDRVRRDQVADIMGVQKYDIPLRDGSGGCEVKYWSPAD